ITVCLRIMIVDVTMCDMSMSSRILAVDEDCNVAVMIIDNPEFTEHVSDIMQNMGLVIVAPYSTMDTTPNVTISTSPYICIDTSYADKVNHMGSADIGQVTTAKCTVFIDTIPISRHGGFNPSSRRVCAHVVNVTEAEEDPPGMCKLDRK